MRAPAAHVRQCRDGVLQRLVLHIKVPLLHVRPANGSGNGHEAHGELNRPAAAKVVVTGDVVLHRSPDQGRGLAAAHHALDVPFIAVGVLPEKSIPATNRSFARSERIPGEADSRSRIEEVPLHATFRHSVHPALHQAVERIAGAGN